MNQVAVTISTKHDVLLKGIVQKPNGDGPFPTVMFVHGLGMTMHEWNGSFDEIAGLLSNAGFLTIQFQFPIFDTKGKCRELPISKRAAIFDDVVRWAKGRADVDTDRIGILAQSYGVPTLLHLVRSDLDAQGLTFAKSLVFVSGTYFPKRSIERVYTERGVTINYEGDTSLPRLSGENTTVGKEFWQDIDSFDPIAQVKNLTMPVFLIHGDQDTKVTIAEVEKVYEAIARKDKKLKIFKGGDHGITDVPHAMREIFLRDVVEWFHSTL